MRYEVYNLETDKYMFEANTFITGHNYIFKDCKKDGQPVGIIFISKYSKILVVDRGDK